MILKNCFQITTYLMKLSLKYTTCFKTQDNLSSDYLIRNKYYMMVYKSSDKKSLLRKQIILLATENIMMYTFCNISSISCQETFLNRVVAQIIILFCGVRKKDQIFERIFTPSRGVASNKFQFQHISRPCHYYSSLLHLHTT